MAAKKTKTDWEAVERDYRAGVKSLRQIGEEAGCSHVAIQKRAAREGWTRDLSAKIRAAADAKVTRDAVTSEVTVETKTAERAVVEANAELQANILRAHRKDITRARTLALALLAELEQQTGNLGTFEDLAEMLRTEEGGDKLAEFCRKVVALPSRVDSAKKLAETLKTLIGLERQAFGLEERVSPESDEAGYVIIPAKKGHE